MRISDLLFVANNTTASGEEKAVAIAAAAICERLENLDATLRELDGTLLEVLRDQNEILARIKP